MDDDAAGLRPRMLPVAAAAVVAMDAESEGLWGVVMGAKDAGGKGVDAAEACEPRWGIGVEGPVAAAAAAVAEPVDAMEELRSCERGECASQRLMAGQVQEMWRGNSFLPLVASRRLRRRRIYRPC